MQLMKVDSAAEIRVVGKPERTGREIQGKMLIRYHVPIVDLSDQTTKVLDIPRSLAYSLFDHMISTVRVQPQRPWWKCVLEFLHIVARPQEEFPTEFRITKTFKQFAGTELPVYDISPVGGPWVKSNLF